MDLRQSVSFSAADGIGQIGFRGCVLVGIADQFQRDSVTKLGFIAIVLWYIRKVFESHEGAVGAAGDFDVNCFSFSTFFFQSQECSASKNSWVSPF